MSANATLERHAATVTTKLKRDHDLKSGIHFEVVGETKPGGKFHIIINKKKGGWSSEYTATVHDAATRGGFTYEIK